jgi:phospholipid/cholesterol/gamma-HCH transport system ATP-binding protein
MITHDLDSLYAITDKVAVLADKKVVAVAPVQELETFGSSLDRNTSWAARPRRESISQPVAQAKTEA